MIRRRNLLFCLGLSKGRLPSFQMLNNDKEEYIFLCRHKFSRNTNNISVLSNINQKNWENAIKDRTVRALTLSKVLVEILIKFDTKIIEVIPLKGPVLAFTLYGDIGKRYFSDLDLIVRREDIFIATETLEIMGYEQRHPRSDLSDKKLDYYFKWKKDIGLVNREQGVFVELHTGIYYHELLKKKKERLFFEDLTEETLAGTTVKCMNRNNTFLYLTYHGAQHMYFRLFWLRDVSEALKRWELDHEKILRNAYELGIERLLGVSLELVWEFFDAEIPQEYHSLLANMRAIIKKLKKLCMKRILGPEELSFSGKLRKHYYLMSLKPGIKYKWVAFQSIFHRWYIRKFLGGN